MVEINFSPAEMAEVARVAILRNQTKVDAGIPSNRYAENGMTDEQSHFNGLMGEFAAAWYLGGEVDKTPRLKGDKGNPDFWVNGISFEIKYTNLLGGDFIVPHRDPFKFVADIGIVCHPGFNNRRVILSSWVTRDEFLNNYHIRDYGKGDRAAIKQVKMRNIETLRGIVSLVAEPWSVAPMASVRF